MRVAYVISLKPLCYLLSLDTKAIYVVLYLHDMNTSMHYYFLPTSYERDYVSYVS